MGGTKFFFVIGLLLFSTACSTLKPTPQALTDKTFSCRYLFSDFERAVRKAERRDVQSARVEDYPYLRINRFLLSFRYELDSDAKFNFWVARMMSLAQETHYFEWQNLSEKTQTLLKQTHGINDSFSDRLAECGEHLWQVDRDEAKKILPDQVDVAGVYRTSWRVLGLYPLTSRFISSQVKKLHAELKQPFLLAADSLAVSGQLIRYASNKTQLDGLQTTAGILQNASNNALHIPLPKNKTLDLLFFRYAPVWEIDQVTDDDLIGQPYWDDGKYPRVDVSKPTLYQHISHTRFGGQVLLQLNYTVWFPARPRTGLFDLFGGRFDGITWRVTLDNDGQPLMYDTMHNCGCYHQWFISDRLALRQEAFDAELEPPLVLLAPKLDDAQRMVLRINSHEHFLQNIYSAEMFNENDVVLAAKPYNALRSLGQGRRSLFDESGIVPGSQRAERWLLWPMGVPAAGAMRQVGHHAIVFAGQRYFDEPYLLQRFFY